MTYNILSRLNYGCNSKTTSNRTEQNLKIQGIKISTMKVTQIDSNNSAIMYSLSEKNSNKSLGLISHLKNVIKMKAYFHKTENFQKKCKNQLIRNAINKIFKVNTTRTLRSIHF
uniref:Uncharacterized protein n=1 Tax=Micrurus spixii TaxID=129469 RepID=A0A2D4LPG6_9SAUR